MTTTTAPTDDAPIVSEVPGQPGRVITGGSPAWSSTSGEPDPITRKPDLFPCDDEES